MSLLLCLDIEIYVFNIFPLVTFSRSMSTNCSYFPHSMGRIYSLKQIFIMNDNMQIIHLHIDVVIILCTLTRVTNTCI